MPGLAKTRLATAVGDVVAADIAAAALLDTLDAVAAAPVRSRVVAMTGDLNDACRRDEIRERLADFTVVAQRGADFAERLANAHVDAAEHGLPVLQIGMDTPQVTAEMIGDCAEVLLYRDAVLGMALDGGWWVLGVANPAMADCLRTVPMSRSDTGAVTLAALRDTGIDVEPGFRTRRFRHRRRHRTRCARCARPGADSSGRQGRCRPDMLGNLYDRALDGERCWVRHADGEIRNLPVRRWLGGQGADDRFDSAVVKLCSGPTIDLGCGPGRLVTELVRRGVPALGVDQSATAVALARRGGAPVLRRDVFESLPATGRWQTVLLADGNVGLGGDPLRGAAARGGTVARAAVVASPNSIR